jgi:hypothetical protein
MQPVFKGVAFCGIFMPIFTLNKIAKERCFMKSIDNKEKSSVEVLDIFIKKLKESIEGGKSPKWALTSNLRAEASNLKLLRVSTERRKSE